MNGATELVSPIMDRFHLPKLAAIWMLTAMLLGADFRVCLAQVFGGCDCSGPPEPKPTAELEAERTTVRASLNGLHDRRDKIMAEYAKKTLRQAKIVLLQKYPFERLIEAKFDLDVAQGALLAAIAVNERPATILKRRERLNECQQAFDRIQGEVDGIQSEFDALENEKRELYQEAQQLRFVWIGKLSVVDRDEFVADRLELLDAEIGADDKFADGYLYRSLLHLQQGDVDSARKDIREARELMYGTTSTLNVRFRSVFQPAQIVDMVYASLLLGQEKPAWNYVEICRQRFPEFVNHPVYLHMKAKYEECENSFTTAAGYYRKAIKVVEGWAGNPPEETYNVEELYSDAAWFFAASPSSRHRDFEDSLKYAEKALLMTGCKSWVAWRSVAAVKAAEQKWETAINALEHCRVHAPQNFAAELDEQEAAYQNHELFQIKRRKK